MNILGLCLGSILMLLGICTLVEAFSYKGLDEEFGFASITLWGFIAILLLSHLKTFSICFVFVALLVNIVAGVVAIIRSLSEA